MRRLNVANAGIIYLQDWRVAQTMNLKDFGELYSEAWRISSYAVSLASGVCSQLRSQGVMGKKDKRGIS